MTDDKIAEIHRRHEFAGTHMRPAEFYWTIPGLIAHIDRAFLLAEVDRLREALREWDALIKHQYSGTRDAMSDMQYAALNTKRILDELESKP